MLQRYIGILALVLGMMGCQKKDNFDMTGYKSEAVIVGYYDVDDCTGGYALNIIDDPQYSKLLFSLELPQGVNINKGSIFPVKVAINWEMDQDYCPTSLYIKVLSLKKM